MLARLLAVGIGIVSALGAAPARAQTGSFSDADYWAFADRMTSAIDAEWSPARGAYVVNGNASTRQNSMMLLTHAVAALEGHAGPTRQDARARLIIDRLTEPPAWLGAGGAGREARRSTCWSALLDSSVPQHKSLEPKVAEALAWAWRARFALGLSAEAVRRMVATVDRCARSPAWRYPRAILNQINWSAEMYAADATLTGRPGLLVRDYRRQLVRFTAGIRRARAGARASSSTRCRHMSGRSPPGCGRCRGGQCSCCAPGCCGCWPAAGHMPGTSTGTPATGVSAGTRRNTGRSRNRGSSRSPPRRASGSSRRRGAGPRRSSTAR